MRAPAIACVVLALAGGCGKKKKTGPATPETAMPVAPTPVAVTSAPPARGSDMAWNEAFPLPPSSAPPYQHSFDPGPPLATPKVDPDAVVARYKAECPPGTTTSACHDLRLQVEQVLLADIIKLHSAGQPIDREWYRRAVHAETPQLACLAARALAFATDRKPADDAALLDALDHPAQSVRDMVLSSSTPAIVELRKRAALNQQPTSGGCFDDLRDVDPGPTWAGGYPGARFRYFASSSSLRWFTTTDPVDKVLGYFAKGGRAAQTKDELAAAGQRKMIEETTRLTRQAEPIDNMKAAEQLQELAARAGNDWGEQLRGIEGAGEIRFVMLAPNQAIAIFKDDVLHATSIVATRPVASVAGLMDPEKLQKEAFVRQVFGF